eukprot:812060-Prorocentrum_minimum.AAC.1
MDGVANVLGPELLKEMDLTFPRIIVVGQESTGKSSVLERIAMLPLFPRGEDICTRLPIELRLQHTHLEQLESFCNEQTLHVRPPISSHKTNLHVRPPMSGC